MIIKTHNGMIKNENRQSPLCEYGVEDFCWYNIFHVSFPVCLDVSACIASCTARWALQASVCELS